MKKIYLFMVIFYFTGFCYANQIPTGQDVGSTLKGYSDSRKKSKIISEITYAETSRPSLTEQEAVSLPKGMDKIYIKEIIIQQPINIKYSPDEYELNKIIEKHKNLYFTFDEIKNIAELIRQTYSANEINSYIPKQSFKNNKVYINITEK